MYKRGPAAWGTRCHTMQPTSTPPRYRDSNWLPTKQASCAMTAEPRALSGRKSLPSVGGKGVKSNEIEPSEGAGGTFGRKTLFNTATYQELLGGGGYSVSQKIRIYKFWCHQTRAISKK